MKTVQSAVVEMGEEERMETIEYEEIAGEIDTTIRVAKREISTREGAVVREKTSYLFLASCGHLIHDSSEVGGRCLYKNCNAIVCTKCARWCSRCFKLLCPKHQKLHRTKRARARR
jgi:hypothetical protein